MISNQWKERAAALHAALVGGPFDIHHVESCGWCKKLVTELESVADEASRESEEREAAMLEQFHHLVDVADGYLQVKEFLKEDRFDLTNAKVILDRRDNQVRKERTKAEKNFPVETERSKDGDVHTMPTFDGFDHESDSNCGCRPEVCYTAPNGNRVWLHKVIQ